MSDKSSAVMAELVRGLMRQPGIDLPAKPADADGEHCPKCGWRGGPTDGGEWRTWAYCSPAEAIQIGVKQGECLMVYCSRCRYRWHEPVLQPEVGPS